jgi:hypothetical protein
MTQWQRRIWVSHVHQETGTSREKNAGIGIDMNKAFMVL